MKLLVVSDLHLEFGAGYAPPPETDFDVVILAGDVHTPGWKGVRWAARIFGKPVLYVPGNHEYYRCDLDAQLQDMRRDAQGTNVIVMDRDALTLNCGQDAQAVRFLGVTLWTDFRLPTADRHGQPIPSLQLQALADVGLNDFRLIGRDGTRFSALESARLNAQGQQWLRAELSQPHDGPTVVITHHGPSAGSVAPLYENDQLTPAFVSHLGDEFFEVPTLWVHGHTHTRFDYLRGNCRVVCNPRGYPISGDRAGGGSFECNAFAPGFVVEVGL